MSGSPSLNILDDLAKESYNSSDAPLHEVVQKWLTRIIERHFEDGQRFWTEAEVCHHLNVSRVTVRRALTSLADQGRLVRHRSRGTFVRSDSAQYPQCRQAAQEASPKSVGAIVPYLGSPFWSEVLDHVAEVTAQAGLSFHAYTSTTGEASGSTLAQLTSLPSEEAIVLLGHTNVATEDLYRTLVGRGYRVVTVDSPIRGLPAPFVGVDNDMGVFMCTRHLIERGHRRIAMLSYEPPDNVNTQLRVSAFRAVMSDSGIADAQVLRVDLSIPHGKGVGVALDAVWCREDTRPTALFCDSAGGAITALKWCMERGIGVPRDLSIVSFDNSRQIQYSRPPLTCTAQPIRKIAEVVMELLTIPEDRHILLPPTLIVRGSTGSPCQIHDGELANSLKG